MSQVAPASGRPSTRLPQEPASPRGLRMAVHGLGSLAFLAYGGLAVLSYPHAAALWRTEDAPRAQAFFDILAAGVQNLSPTASAWLSAGAWPSDNIGVMVEQCLLLLVPTVALVAVLGILAVAKDRADERTVLALRNWGVAFALVSVPAYPVFTQDFWLSAVWGGMIGAADNPYHRLFTATDVGTLPLDHFAMAMSYGPLWGLISAAVMLATSGSRLMVTALAFKLVLLVAWLGCLAAIARLTRNLGDVERCRAIAIFGWAPASVSQTVAEGHNDVAMVVMILVWLVMLAQDRWQAPIALAASVLCKFASAPLALVESIEILRREQTWSRRFARVIAPTLFGLGAMALFYRSPRFFDGIFLINEWHFLQPRDAINAIGQLVGLPFGPTGRVIALAFPAFAAYRLLISYRDPCLANQIKAAVAIMAAILFAGVAHIWPWYLIWGLGLAVLAPSWWLSRFIIGVGLLVPFTLATWWVEALDSHRDLASLILYAFAGLWCLAPMLFTRRERGATATSARTDTHQAQP